jgi:DNA-binding NarL/FixJ family response regulator
MMDIVLLSNDLMVVSRVSGAAAASGAVVRVAANATAAISLLSARAAELVVIDLGLPALDLESLISDIKADSMHPAQVIAFGPHVHADRLAAARSAGCDTVLSRGQFFAQADAVVSGAAL